MNYNLFDEINLLKSKRKLLLDSCDKEEEKNNASLSLDLIILERIDKFIAEKCVQEDILKAFEIYSEITLESLKNYLNRI